MNDTTKAQANEGARRRRRPMRTAPPMDAGDAERDGFAVDRGAERRERRVEGPRSAHPGRNGEPAPPHRARSLGRQDLWRQRVCARHARCRRQSVAGVGEPARRTPAPSADGVKSFIDGVELTARDLQAALARHGVKKLEPQGEKFDPNFHQAIFEDADETVPSGTVAKVVQSGWAIGDRVLRPAMVGVSKGGPKAVKAE